VNASSPSSVTPCRNLDPEQLKPFLQGVLSYTEDFIYGVPTELFHYTDLGGLQGIVGNHDLWLTHCRYCNDDEEMHHGYRVAGKVVKDQAGTNPSKDYPEYLTAIQRQLTQPVNVYICCFCKADNLLSQWRGYGANGTGVSIAIDPTGLRDLTGSDSPPAGLIRLWKVFYEEQEQREIIESLIRTGFILPGTIEERASLASAAIQFFVPTLKNADFKEEQECRLIFSPTLNCPIKPRFRTGRGMLIPYYSLGDLRASLAQSPELPIKAVRIGPSANKALNKASASMLLSHHGYATVPVECSEIPYRG
jgi:hypothetical protein